MRASLGRDFSLVIDLMKGASEWDAASAALEKCKIIARFGDSQREPRGCDHLWPGTGYWNRFVAAVVGARNEKCPRLTPQRGRQGTLAWMSAS